MRKLVYTNSGNIVKVHVRPIDWKYGNEYGIRARLTGECPAMFLSFGDGHGDGFCSWDFEGRHEYPKDTSQSYIVELSVVCNNIIDYIEPCCGDCEYELVDFSNAPDILSAYIKHCNDIKLNNPQLKKLELYILKSHEIDFSSCISLKELSIGCGENIKELDLTNCLQLERLYVCGYSSKSLTNIKISNDCPLQYADLRGCKLHPGCISAIRRIVERNGGTFEDKEGRIYII